MLHTAGDDVGRPVAVLMRERDARARRQLNVQIEHRRIGPHVIGEPERRPGDQPRPDAFVLQRRQGRFGVMDEIGLGFLVLERQRRPGLHAVHQPAAGPDRGVGAL